MKELLQIRDGILLAQAPDTDILQATGMETWEVSLDPLPPTLTKKLPEIARTWEKTLPSFTIDDLCTRMKLSTHLLLWATRAPLHDQPALITQLQTILTDKQTTRTDLAGAVGQATFVYSLLKNPLFPSPEDEYHYQVFDTEVRDDRQAYDYVVKATSRQKNRKQHVFGVDVKSTMKNDTVHTQTMHGDIPLPRTACIVPIFRGTKLRSPQTNRPDYMFPPIPDMMKQIRRSMNSYLRFPDQRTIFKQRDHFNPHFMQS